MASLKLKYAIRQPHHNAFMRPLAWSSHGSCIVSHDKVILTSDTKSQKGSIWHSKPIEYHNWKIVVDFTVHGAGNSLYGDGFAFWYTKEHANEGPVFGNKDYFRGLGIIFDTYSNLQEVNNFLHPYISAQINDGSVHYNQDTDGRNSELSGCHLNILNLETNLMTFCFLTEGVELPTGYHIGFSAATGDLSDNHEILSVEFHNLDAVLELKYRPNEFHNIIPKASHSRLHNNKYKDFKGKSSFWIFVRRFAIFLLLLSLSAMALTAIFYFLNKREMQRRKRFY
ncbi:hypothetical protein MXB_4315 [Myxobolus squamalis]|nr:hypothetical protein MXB_4315 [Myxobolus squamalis]